MSLCRVISYVIGTRHLQSPVCSLDKTLLAFALLHFVLQCHLACYSRYLLTSYVCIPIPYNEKDIFSFLMLVLESLLDLHRTIQLQFLQHQGLGAQTWLTGILNGLTWKWQDHSVIFEIAPKYYISESSVDYEGYSLSSKEFLPTVVDIMVIWFKFAYSCQF